MFLFLWQFSLYVWVWIRDSSKVPLCQWLDSYLEGYELKNKQATVRIIDILSPMDLECHQAWLHLAWGGEACLGLLLLDLIFTIWKTNIYGYTWVYSRQYLWRLSTWAQWMALYAVGVMKYTLLKKTIFMVWVNTYVGTAEFKP